jgi:hypothetical protein
LKSSSIERVTFIDFIYVYKLTTVVTVHAMKAYEVEIGVQQRGWDGAAALGRRARGATKSVAK